MLQDLIESECLYQDLLIVNNWWIIKILTFGNIIFNMIKKSISKLVGLKKDEFDSLVKSGQIQLQPARLIPSHKTGDE